MTSLEVAMVTTYCLVKKGSDSLFGDAGNDRLGGEEGNDT
jgi:Ca2+-binding RTX toxin-like protein